MSGVSLVGVTGKVSFGASLVSPYTPSDRSAKITGAEGRRILTLDDRPAAKVLNEWMGGQIETQYKEGGSIGLECSTFPLAIQKENGSYASLHAAGVNAPEGSIDCFAQAEVGQTLTVMNKDGGKDSVLAASLGLERAYDAAKQKGGMTEPAAGLFIYCGGLSFAVGDRFEESLAPLKDKAPMIGSTVFGEQGNFDGCNLHCNLAVGVALFE
ncbi:hypothetical protein BSKO_04619 [Bryopsis sp. KO-2023]|nr:hypothetical protein BSKO_04619 [Bryopsis sp. KO-2023]